MDKLSIHNETATTISAFQAMLWSEYLADFDALQTSSVYLLKLLAQHISIIEHILRENIY